METIRIIGENTIENMTDSCSFRDCPIDDDNMTVYSFSSSEDSLDERDKPCRQLQIGQMKLLLVHVTDFPRITALTTIKYYFCGFNSNL